MVEFHRMIFYKAIKYSILQVAMDIMFDRILFNTRIGHRKISISDLSPGMKIAQINYLGVIFYDCMIHEFHKGHGDDISWYIYIYYNQKENDSDTYASTNAHDNRYKFYSGICPDDDTEIEIYR
jgi:hypothetical protein